MLLGSVSRENQGNQCEIYSPPERVFRPVYPCIPDSRSPESSKDRGYTHKSEQSGSVIFSSSALKTLLSAGCVQPSSGDIVVWLMQKWRARGKALPCTAALPQGMKSQRGKRELEDNLNNLKLILRSLMAKPGELQSTGVVLNTCMAPNGHFLH